MFHITAKPHCSPITVLEGVAGLAHTLSSQTGRKEKDAVIDSSDQDKILFRKNVGRDKGRVVISKTYAELQATA